MPSDFRDPKTLAQWIELDYHTRNRWLRRWQTWLTVGTLLVGGAIAGVYAVLPHAQQSYQAGSLSAAHALFSDDCRQCHTQAFRTTHRFVDPSATTVLDTACEQCHAGPPHNEPFVLARDKERCAECHHEHHGRDFLARVSDNECVDCHGAIHAHSARGKGSPFKDVSDFPANHPPLQMSPDKGHPVTETGADRGSLYFNHKAHLNNEKVVVALDQGGTRLLECADCHRTDAGKLVAGEAGKPPRFELAEKPRLDEAGRYMQPIRYDRHCQACHPLSVRLTGVFEGKEAQEAEEWFRKQVLPHPGRGQTAEVVRGVISDRLFELVRRHPGLAPETDGPGIPRPPEDVTESQWRWVQKKTESAGEFVFWKEQKKRVDAGEFQLSGGCRLCHALKKPADAAQAPDALPVVIPPNLPQQWWVHARFDHQRHRMVQCTECHAGATTSEKTADVLLPPDLNLCAQCHSAEARGSAAARHDCIECHRYHPHRSADPTQPRSLSDLLRR
jgi:hypothetical protein